MQEETKISNGVKNILEKVKPTFNKILSFLLLIGIAVSIITIVQAEELIPTEEPIPQVPPGIAADKTSYAVSEIIRISNTPLGSAVEIYWLDNPDTALNPDPESWPSNVYATLVNDDGTVNIDAATLSPGRYVLVNTFEKEHCGGLYLAQCRANNDYLGEVLLTINP
jgi:hypothetical protein